MAKLRINDLLIYRWRYAIGYGIVGILLVASLFFAGLMVPGGLSQHEMASTVASSSINFDDLSQVVVPDLPYHLLQLLSINLLGVTTLSVKLPSLIFGLLTAVGIIFLLRQWFSYNVALLAAIIAISTSQFLFIAQNGTPLIMHMFWPVWLLLSATMIARHVRPVLVWRILFFILAALSLYTPLSIYILITIAIAVMLHPHLRYLFWRIPSGDIAFSAIVAGLLLIPLVYTIVIKPDFGLMLLGFTNIQPDILNGLTTVAKQIFDFRGAALAPNGMMLPLFSLGSILLILLGVFSVARARHSVKTYLILLWLLLLIPLTISEPSHLIIAFVPMILLLASGLSFLFQYWYKLFPKNPYARIAGLLPLAILVGGLVASGLERYLYGYMYSTTAANAFSSDMSLLNKEVSRVDGPVTLVAGESELKFYQAVADKSNDKIVVSGSPASSETDRIILTREAHSGAPEGKELDRIVADGMSENSDRLYVYKNPRS